MVVVLAVAAGLAWLPILTKPLSADEGGYLLVASQWHAGSSVYGNYFVDRPPLLISLFQLADALGGAVPLRLLGALCAVLSVLFAAILGRALGGARRTPVLAAATAAVFLSTPMFTAAIVDGELLSSPFVLGGLATAAVACRTEPGRRRTALWLLAGVAATAAVMVKQNMIDVAVFAAVALVLQARRRGLATAVRDAVSFAVGAVLILGVVLLWADLHGTGLVPLWHAVTTFRTQALHAVSTHSNAHRAHLLLLSFLASGAVVLVLAAALPRLRGGPPRGRRRTVPDAAWLAAAVLTWDAVSVVGGGSFWTHYLICLVPGLVLTAIVVGEHRPSRVRWVAVGLVYAAAIGVVSVVWLAIHQTSESPTREVEEYLIDHSRPGDTAVVGFGDPAILQAAQLHSPYPNLWVLPVRVLDPHLTELTAILRSDRRPDWMILDGPSLTAPGIDGSTAQPFLRRNYQFMYTDGRFSVYELRSRWAAQSG